ncbi:SKA complex subunit 1 [Ara ararauna]
MSKGFAFQLRRLRAPERPPERGGFKAEPFAPRRRLPRSLLLRRVSSPEPSRRWAQRGSVRVMAEALLSSGTLFSDLDILLAEVEKISALKKLLELARAGQEPSLKCMVSEIRDQIMVLHGLLSKIESEFQHNVEMRTSLKELQDTVEKEQKEAQYFLEVLSSRSAWESCGFAETEKHAECQLVKGKKPTKASETEGFPRKMLAVTPKDLKEVPV